MVKALICKKLWAYKLPAEAADAIGRDAFAGEIVPGGPVRVEYTLVGACNRSATINDGAVSAQIELGDVNYRNASASIASAIGLCSSARGVLPSAKG